MSIPLNFLLLCVFPWSQLFAQTQAELTEASRKKLRVAELELKTVFEQIKREYKDDKEFVGALNDAQVTWEKFRVTEMKMMFPDREPSYYGSAHQMCLNEYSMELIQERIAKLKLWLTGVEEGDVCAGSVKWKESGKEKE